jgi:hypothetical protein
MGNKPAAPKKTAKGKNKIESIYNVVRNGKREQKNGG